MSLVEFPEALVGLPAALLQLEKKGIVEKHDAENLCLATSGKPFSMILVSANGATDYDALMLKLGEAVGSGKGHIVKNDRDHVGYEYTIVCDDKIPPIIKGISHEHCLSFKHQGMHSGCEMYVIVSINKALCKVDVRDKHYHNTYTISDDEGKRYFPPLFLPSLLPEFLKELGVPVEIFKEKIDSMLSFKFKCNEQTFRASTSFADRNKMIPVGLGPKFKLCSELFNEHVHAFKFSGGLIDSYLHVKYLYYVPPGPQRPKKGLVPDKKHKNVFSWTEITENICYPDGTFHPEFSTPIPGRANSQIINAALKKRKDGVVKIYNDRKKRRDTKAT